MITFYTAVGRYVLRKDGENQQYPVVITHGNESRLDVQEMVIWSSLLWKVSTYDELKNEYLYKTQSAQVSGQYRLEHYLNRLQQRGLIVSGKDYVGIDALYNLLSRLNIIPISDSFIAKIAAFFMFSFRGVPLRVTKKMFSRAKLSNEEKQVLNLARQQRMSTAELIQCVEQGVTDISTEDKLVEALYSDESTTGANIHISSQFAAARQPVLQAVANLYQQKQVILERML